MQELIQLYKNSLQLSDKREKMENKYKALEYFSEQSWGYNKLSTYADNEKTAWKQISGSKDLDQTDVERTKHWLRYEVERKQGDFMLWINDFSRWNKIDTKAKESKALIVEQAISNLNISLNMSE
jgi:hypothetical protein|tara:strand:- start:790 stop:1164 length:375 start_codon:yes stop_codon:yes gene_type:complete